MKFKILSMVVCFSCYLLTAAPKKAKVDITEPVSSVDQKEKEEEEPVITEECQSNISIMHENVKNKQFAGAYSYWQKVYNECPNANKVIYTDGAKIIEWLFENAKTDKERSDLAKLAIEICDKRIKYFGNDTKYPKTYILGEKGLEYCKYFTKDSTKAKAYPWLKESVKALKNNSKISVLVKLAEVSYLMYKSAPDKYREQYLSDYTLVSDILSSVIANEKGASSVSTYKDYIDNVFAQSGVASCDKLDELYGKMVTESKNDLDKLQKIIRLYKRINCTESDIYFTASQYVHQQQPSEESAVGCAKMCIKKDDQQCALDYYQQALDIIGDAEDDDKDDYHYMMAFIYSDKMKRYEIAKNHLLKAIALDGSVGRYYILLGLCYANAKPFTEKDGSAAKCAILNKSVYWVVVDKFIKAKTVDPSCTEDANKLIATYSKYFPTKEEIFDLPNEFGKEGNRFHVGGWVNETTTCRALK